MAKPRLESISNTGSTPAAQSGKQKSSKGISSRVGDGRRPTDTIRLWEGYKDQAILWRSLSLLQLPITAAALIFCIILWGTHEIKVIAPAEAKPGIVALKDIPDNNFVDSATDFVNLIATYQHPIARRQFTSAREMLSEPMLTTFDQEILGSELRAIEATNRTQIFFVDVAKTKLLRKPDEVAVSFIGDRQKYVAGKDLPAAQARITVTLRTLPKNKLNPFGIVVSNYKIEDLS